MTRNGRQPVRVLIAIWCVATIGAMAALSVYENRPGPVESPAAEWPEAAPFRHPGHDVLLVFVHPCCPCTRATVEQLDRLITAIEGEGPERHVFIFQPRGESADFGDTDLRAHLERLEDIRLREDPDGVVAAAFGAVTSGTVRYYDALGRLRFHGGITPSRGHLGDDVGSQCLKALIRGDEAPVARTPVYGCSIVDEGAR